MWVQIPPPQFKEMVMNKTSIHLGYEVSTGNQVAIPLRHMVITGQTQEAGKTTALEALIGRSALRAVTFVTKRGEGSFTDAKRVKPYFREQADWQFVASILEASRGEKLKFERAWIIRASRGAKTLADVHRNVRASLEKKSSGKDADVYTVLDAYLEVVVPLIAKVKWATSVDLAPGVNVVDLSDLASEMQHLVIRSTLHWVLNRERDTVVVVPEAWKFIPQGRGTPVKLACEEYIRQGAGLRNYLWLDSQDIAGVDKIILKSVPVWLLGVQRESNEIQRTLDQIPAGIKKPKPAEIATLGLGQFYACWHQNTIKTYVQPIWMESADAIDIATGKANIENAPHQPQIDYSTNTTQLPDDPAETDEVMSSATDQKLDRITGLLEQFVTMKNLVGNTNQPATTPKPDISPKGQQPIGESEDFREEDLYQRFKARLIRESPHILKVITDVPELNIQLEKKSVQADGASLIGRIAMLIVRGWMDEVRTNSAIVNELGRIGGKTIAPRVTEATAKLKVMGFLTDEGNGFQAVKEMKKLIIPSK